MRVLLLALVLLAPLPVRAGEPTPSVEPDPQAWRFGVGVAGAWGGAWVDAEEVVLRSSTIDVFGNVRTRTEGTDRGTLEPRGFAVEGDLRAWLPVALLGAQPWVSAGYRQGVDRPSDEDRFRVSTGVLRHEADLEIAFRRAAAIHLGLDYRLPVRDCEIVLAPVLGADLAWFTATLDARSGLVGALGPTVTDTHLFPGIAAGLETRLPVVRRPSARLELTFGALYRRYFGDGEVKTAFSSPMFAGTPPLDEARYAPEDAFSVRLGLLVSFL